MASVGYRIFISHSHLDNDFGTKLAQDLRRVLAEEDAVFYDVLGGLHGGERWWEKIVKELTARDVLLLALSPDAMNSRWVRREIDVALNEDKIVIPLLYRSCTIRADLKILEIISFVAPKPYEVAFQEVLAALGLPKEPPVAREDIVRHAVEPTDLSTILMQQMETAFANRDWPDVIRKASYLIKRASGSISPIVYRLQGIALLEEGNVLQAQEALETALALVSMSDRELRITLLSDYTALLARQEQWAEVLLRAREALQLMPNDPGWLATQQQAQSKIAESASVPSQTSQVVQKTVMQWINEGLSFYELKQYEKAIAAYDQAISLDPNIGAVYYNKGLAFNELKQYEEARVAFNQAIRLNYNPDVVYYNKGIALYLAKRCEEAIPAFDEAIRLNPNNAEAYYGKGMALNDIKRYGEAISAFDQAIRLNSTNAKAYYYKGNALKNLGEARRAQQAYKKATLLGFNG